MTTAALLTESVSLGLAYSCRGLVRPGGKHGGTQAGMVLEKELRVLHLDPQVEVDCVPHWM